MYQAPFEKMVCDSDYGDGGIYFYEEYFQWTCRDNGKGFKVEYKNIADVDVVLIAIGAISEKVNFSAMGNRGIDHSINLGSVEFFPAIIAEDAAGRIILEIERVDNFVLS